MEMEQEGPPEMEYGHFHKIVLQGIMASGILDSRGVKAVFRAACKYLNITGEEEVRMCRMDNVSVVVRSINDQLRDYNLAIKTATCEIECKKYLLLIPTIERAVWRFQMYFSKPELDHFLLILKGIMYGHNNYAIPLNEAINLIRQVNSSTPLTTSETFVMKLLEMAYFAKYKRNEGKEFDLTLGIRCLKEFEHMLLELYADIFESCQLCKGILLQGYRCSGCKVLVHAPCFKRYVKEPDRDDGVSSMACVNAGSNQVDENDRPIPPCLNRWTVRFGGQHNMVIRTRAGDTAIENEGSEVELNYYGMRKDRNKRRMEEATAVDENPPQIEPEVARLKTLSITKR